MSEWFSAVCGTKITSASGGHGVGYLSLTFDDGKVLRITADGQAHITEDGRIEVNSYLNMEVE